MLFHKVADRPGRSDCTFFCWALVLIGAVIRAEGSFIHSLKESDPSQFSPRICQRLPQPSPPDVHTHRAAEHTTGGLDPRRIPGTPQRVRWGLFHSNVHYPCLDSLVWHHAFGAFKTREVGEK